MIHLQSFQIRYLRCLHYVSLVHITSFVPVTYFSLLTITFLVHFLEYVIQFYDFLFFFRLSIFSCFRNSFHPFQCYQQHICHCIYYFPFNFPGLIHATVSPGQQLQPTASRYSAMKLVVPLCAHVLILFFYTYENRFFLFLFFTRILIC